MICQSCHGLVLWDWKFQYTKCERCGAINNQVVENEEEQEEEQEEE